MHGLPPHPPLKYFISVGGFRPPTALADHLLATPYATPTLHVIGATDVVSPLERVPKLIVLGAHTRVVWHTGGEAAIPYGLGDPRNADSAAASPLAPCTVCASAGHFVPVRKAWPTFFRHYMADPHTRMRAPGERAGAAQPAEVFAAPAPAPVPETPLSAVSAPSTGSDDVPPAYSAPALTLDAMPAGRVSVGVQAPCLSPARGHVSVRTRFVGGTKLAGKDRWGHGDGTGWASVAGSFTVTGTGGQEGSFDCFSFISG